MRTPFNPGSANLQRYQAGPLAQHVPAIAELLGRHGYTDEHARTKLRQLRDFSCWLRRKRIKVGAINEYVVAAFRARRRNRSKYYGDGATLRLLLKYLRALEVAPPPSPVAPQSPIERVVQEYRDHQLNDRCLGEPTVAGYVAAIRRFLANASASGPGDLQKLTVSQINGFVIKETTTRGRKQCQLAASALRSFLRFLMMTGRLKKDLAPHVPAVAGWLASGLPHYMEAADVEILLKSCDRRTDPGKRNYAILLLLARLGLRAGEVSKLELRDLDWRCGEIHIRGKGGRVDRMPLPQDVGKAIVDYLKCRHPESQSKRVFLHARAPFLELVATPPNSVSSIVRRALKQAHLNPPHRGAHILRHSLATRMLGKGASLFQIGQVLRHAHIWTTEIYAKVDLTSLRKLAQPWPGGAS